MTDSSHQKPLDLLVTGGTVVSGQGRQEAALGVRDGTGRLRGRAREHARRTRRLSDVSGKLVLPGVIDSPRPLPGVFEPYRFPGRRARQATAHGGVTTMISFRSRAKRTRPCSPRSGASARRASAGERRMTSRCTPGFSRTSSISPKFPRPVEGGVTTFKVMMGYKNGCRGRCIPDEYFYAALDIAGRHGGTVLVHAENGSRHRLPGEQGLRRIGMDGARFAQEYSRPPELEAENVRGRSTWPIWQELPALHRSPHLGARAR